MAGAGTLGMGEFRLSHVGAMQAACAALTGLFPLCSLTRGSGRFASSAPGCTAPRFQRWHRKFGPLLICPLQATRLNERTNVGALKTRAYSAHG